MSSVEPAAAAPGGSSGATRADAPPRPRARLSGWRGITPDLWMLYANVTLYAICYQMQQPVQLHYVKKFVDAQSDVQYEFGLLRSFFGFVQLIGALVSGVLVDRFGVKGVLILSFFASALSYGALLTADSVWWLYAAQVPTVMQQAVLAVRAYVSYVVDGEHRATYLGYVGVAYGIGFVIGPVLGGVVGEYSLSLNALLSTAGSVLSLLLVQRFVDERPVIEAKLRARKAGEEDNKPGLSDEARSIVNGIRLVGSSPQLLRLLGLKFLFASALALFHSVFTLVASERFGLDAAGIGMIMSVVGIMGMITQTLIVSVVTKHMSERSITIAACFVLAASFGVYAIINSKAALFIICAPIVIANTVYSLVNSSQIVNVAPMGLKGSLVAADMAIFSGVRMLSPTIGAFMLARLGYWSIGATSGAALGILGFVLLLSQPASAAAATPGAAKED